MLVGQDPRAYEARFLDMHRNTRSSPGGIAAPAMLVGQTKDSPIPEITGKRELLHLDAADARADDVPDSSGLDNSGSMHDVTVGPDGLAFNGSDAFVDCGNAVSLLGYDREISWEILFLSVLLGVEMRL